jgi:hypothetical protein
MEVKQEISKIIESLPESILAEVLTFLRDIDKASKDGNLTTMDLRIILKEDHELLQELAK